MSGKIMLVAIFVLAAYNWFDWVAQLRQVMLAVIITKCQRAPLPGTCPRCGYDLRGGHDRCPECGADVTESASDS